MRTESQSVVIMLEDDGDRISRFSRMLSTQTSVSFLHWRTAHAFIESYPQLQQIPRLIALDHDLLVDSEDEPDPGDGRDVAAFLASQTPIAPILIHSSNSIAADSMLFTLRDAGWNVDRISPIGDDWIESDWFPIVKAMLRSGTGVPNDE